MTLPNKLSLFRIFVIPPFVALVMAERIIGGWGSSWLGAAHSAALFLIIVATITDWLDGKIAREYNQQSNLGKLLDPLADKLLVTSAFVCFVALDIFPAWLIIIILCREFIVTGLRSLGSDKGRIIAADKWGKHKTGWQLATIIATIAFMTARDFLIAADVWEKHLVRHWSADTIYIVTLHALLVISVGMTVFSGWIYLRNNWDLVKEG